MSERKYWLMTWIDILFEILQPGSPHVNLVQYDSRESEGERSGETEGGRERGRERKEILIQAIVQCRTSCHECVFVSESYLTQEKKIALLSQNIQC